MHQFFTLGDELAQRNQSPIFQMAAKILEFVMKIHPFAMVYPFFDMHRMLYNMPWKPCAALATIELWAKSSV